MLRARREQLGVSQTELGHALKLTFQQIQKYEKGINRLSASKLFEAAECLRVEPGFFYIGLSRDDQADAEPTATLWPAGKAASRIARAFPQLPRSLQDSFADAICTAAECMGIDEAR